MFLNNYNNSFYLAKHELLNLINLDWNADFFMAICKYLIISGAFRKH
jgi:hypothetical protein